MDNTDKKAAIIFGSIAAISGLIILITKIDEFRNADPFMFWLIPIAIGIVALIYIFRKQVFAGIVYLIKFLKRLNKPSNVDNQDDDKDSH